MDVPETLLDPPRGLDHFVLAVRDLGAAQERFQQLGFTTTPRARHPWGTENVLVQMQGCFIELLGITPGIEIAPTEPGDFSFGFFNQEYLRNREGMSMLVFSSTNATADRQHWLEQGLDTYAPFNFSRIATLEDGQQVPVSFSLAFVSHTEMPSAAWFVCQQHAPENFWKPAFQQHANGAIGVATATLAAAHPGDYKGFLQALFPEGQLLEHPEALELKLPRGWIYVKTVSALESLTPGIVQEVQRFGPLFNSIEVTVRDLGVVRNLLQQRNRVFSEVSDGILIAPEALFGLALLLTEHR